MMQLIETYPLGFISLVLMATLFIVAKWVV